MVHRCLNIQHLLRELVWYWNDEERTREHSFMSAELQIMEQIHEQFVDIPGLVNPHFPSFAEETPALQVVVLLPPFDVFTAPVFNQVHQE